MVKFGITDEFRCRFSDITGMHIHTKEAHEFRTFCDPEFIEVRTFPIGTRHWIPPDIHSFLSERLRLRQEVNEGFGIGLG